MTHLRKVGQLRIFTATSAAREAITKVDVGSVLGVMSQVT